MQSGISSCSKYPYIFIFSGKRGHGHGYKDNWENEDVYSYTGEGQKGDMKFTRGNLVLREHLNSGKRVFLFLEAQKTFVTFQGELEFLDFGYFETLDTEGINRIGIKFFFKRKDAHITYKTTDESVSLVSESDPLTYIGKVPNSTERSGLVTSRVGQGAYRKSIVHRWKGECAVTKFNKPEILIASHIHPWKNATDVERLDVDNGILLSPTYDALFDKNLISFENSGKIILTSNYEQKAYDKLGVTGKEQILRLTEGNRLYLEKHRSLIKF